MNRCRGNFELVAPRAAGGLAAAGLAHWWRANDAPGRPWRVRGPIAAGGGALWATEEREAVPLFSDGICILGHLFLGTPARLPCGSGVPTDPANLRLLDGNDDGAIDLSDAVRVFTFLFLGGSPPAGGTGCLRLEGCPEAGCVP